MSEENPWQPILKSLNSFSHCIQSHISQLLSPLQTQLNFSSKKNLKSLPFFALSSLKPSLNGESSRLHQSEDVSLVPAPLTKGKSVSGLTKEELGRGTWALLHTIAAQYPDRPTKQQKRDVKELMTILSRLYPCKECADHFKEVLKANPIQAGSQAEFSQWLCHVHNVVNRSLGKLTFPCHRVNARWGKLDCQDRACDLEGTSHLK